MISYCGTCGCPVDEQALHAGRCPRCGALVSGSVSGGGAHNALSRSDVASAETPTTPGTTHVGDGPRRPQPDAAAAALVHNGPIAHHAETQPADTEPESRLLAPGAASARRHDQRQRRESSRLALIWMLALLSAVILLLTGAGIAALAHRDPLSIVMAPFTSSSASTSSNASSSASSHSTAGGNPTATANGTGPSTSSTSSGTLTPTPAPTTAPTSTPVPPALSVTPMAITIPVCLGATTQFTVANTGGTPMSWSAMPSPSASYKPTPSSGMLDPGQQQLVTVSVNAVLGKGTVTVTAPTASNSPQHVTITCTA